MIHISNAQTVELSNQSSKKLSLEIQAGRISAILRETPTATQRLLLPRAPTERTVESRSGEVVIMQSTESHKLDASNRWRDPAELPGQIGRQHSTCITIHGAAASQGFIVPTAMLEGAMLVAIDWPHDASHPTFFLFESDGKDFVPMIPKSPSPEAGTMHATQNLSHINEGFKILKEASATGRAHVSLVVPSVARSKMLADEQHEVISSKVRGWTYLEDGNELFSTDLSSPAALESLVGFVACNIDLVRRVRDGHFKVISSDFRAEPQILALINPSSVLVGYNYTFLSGEPHNYARRVKEPALQDLLGETASSLHEFAQRLEDQGESGSSCDWWKLTREKLGAEHQRLDVLAYRTLRYDDAIPGMLDGMPVVQVPHPFAPMTCSRVAERAALAQELGIDLDGMKVIVVPGLSDDGLFEQRLQSLAQVVNANPDVIMVSPLGAEKLAKICGIPQGSPRVYGIGYRENEKWGEVLVACDAAIIRGSWGEILDCVRAGVVPIFSSPGVIEPGGARDRDLFLQEVLGERAMNLALFYEALEAAGIPNDLLRDLVVGSDHSPQTLQRAIEVAAQPAMALAVRETFKKIRRDGVEKLVDMYGWLEGLGRKPSESEARAFERSVWEMQ